MKRLFPFVWLLALTILVPIAVSSDGDMVYCCLRSCSWKQSKAKPECVRHT